MNRVDRIYLFESMDAHSLSEPFVHSFIAADAILDTVRCLLIKDLPPSFMVGNSHNNNTSRAVEFPFSVTPGRFLAYLMS